MRASLLCTASAAASSESTEKLEEDGDTPRPATIRRIRSERVNRNREDDEEEEEEEEEEFIPLDDMVKNEGCATKKDRSCESSVDVCITDRAYDDRK